MLTGWPSSVIWPASSGISPTIIQKEVVLPAPFGPSSPTISPLLTSREISLTTVRAPKRFCKWRAASALWRTDTGYADGAPLEHFSVIFPVSLLRFRHSGSLRGRIHRAARDGTCSARIDPHTVFALAPWANRLKNALNRSAAFMAGFFDRAYCSSQAERQRLL